MIFAFFHDSAINADVIWIKNSENDFNYTVSDVLTDAYYDVTQPLVESGCFSVETEYKACKKILMNAYSHVYIYDSISALRKALSSSENRVWFERFDNQWQLHVQSHPELLNNVCLSTVESI